MTVTNTGNSLLNAMLVGYSWAPTLGTPVTLTYSFMTSAPAIDGVTGFQPISSADQTLIENALKTFSEVANITFTELPAGSSADIAFGQSNQSGSSGLTYQHTGSGAAPSGFTAFSSADVYFANSTTYDPVNFWLVLHEMGNALGIQDFSGYSLDKDAAMGLPAAMANFDYTVMANNWPNHGWNTSTGPASNAQPAPPFSETPQMLDILALQYLYGANETAYTSASAKTTAAGLVYSFNTASPVECVWVGNQVKGAATFDFSACSGTVNIDLTAGSFSATGITPAGFTLTSNGATVQLGGTPYNNISIAYNAVIGIAIGNDAGDTLVADSAQGHNDVMIGGAGADSFTAGGGADIFIGRGGADTAIFHGAKADYTIASLGDGVLLVTDKAASPADGPTLLYGDFTTLTFTDGSVSETASTQGGGTGLSASSALVSANLDNLESLLVNGHLTSIALTDSGIATLTMTAAQLAADSGVLNALAAPNDYVLSVTAGSGAVDIAGEAGHGTVVQFSGASSAYQISADGKGGLTVVNGSATDHLSAITALQFADRSIIVAAAPGTNGVTTGNLTELYSAVFGREPDVPGLAYYQAELATDPSIPLIRFALTFLASPEYTGNPAHTYTQDQAGEAQFITDSYQNLLHRGPAASDVAWYQANVIDPILGNAAPGTAAYAQAQAQAHATLLVDFSASAEFLNDVQITSQHPADAQHWLILT